ncbi:MAG: hypothetical protein OHK0032_07320 [Thermodesulfovibrionales bacterium]
MAFEDIEKLRMRVEKDPNSRLFLPLAEEYRKSGMLDEAISVLLSGLERHPGYTSARVALGKIYIEKNMVNEARDEFEKVVSAIPDNLFAHRKLADIYREIGEAEKAKAEYMEVIRLNPLDEEAKICLDAIEGRVVGIEGKEFEGYPSEMEKGEQKTEDIFEIHEGQVFEIPEESTFEDIFAVESPSGTEPFWSGIDLSPADSLVASGDYYRAMEAYREMLEVSPDNRHLLQRMAELKAFLKLIGKGEAVLIERLEAFLDGIRQRFQRDS